jgi:hypothetical protein
MTDDGLTAWQRYKKNLGETRPWDVLNPNTEHASEEKATARYNLCLECPELVQLTKQCKKCGCVMPLKTKLEKATCPLGKW